MLHRIEKEHMPVGCCAAYGVAEYILSGWSEDNILVTIQSHANIMKKFACKDFFHYIYMAK